MPSNTNTRIYEKLGYIQSRIETLTKKVEHNCQVNKEGDKIIIDTINLKHGETQQKLENHAKYHEENEEKWGILLWMKNHLKTVILITFLISIALASLTGLTIKKAVGWYNEIKSTRISE